jgi:hypothetical protein
VPIADKTITVNGVEVVVAATRISDVPPAYDLVGSVAGVETYRFRLTIGPAEGLATALTVQDLQAALDQGRQDAANHAALITSLPSLEDQIT